MYVQQFKCAGRAPMLTRLKPGVGKLGLGKVGRWFCAEAVNSVEARNN